MKEYLFILLMLCSVAIPAYGQDARPLNERGYALGDVIRKEMREQEYTDSVLFDGRLNDERRLTLLKTLETDTIYGCFSEGYFGTFPFYYVWSSVDRVKFDDVEGPTHNTQCGYLPYGNERRFVREALADRIQVPEDARATYSYFVIKILYEEGAFRVLTAKGQLFDVSSIRW